MKRNLGRRAALALVAGIALVAVGLLGAQPTRSQSQSVTVYSGRTEALVAPLLERFRQQTGLDVRVRYGDTAELAATLLEEGANSPADVFFAQDAGALGAVAQRGMFATLPSATLSRVDARLRAPDGAWVGVSGRARVMAYNTELVGAAELPASVLELTDPKWRGLVAWAPTNGSFQAFVTALRLTEGETAARDWLAGMAANGTRAYRNNTSIVEAVASGEVRLGLVNHYYLYPFLRDRGASFPVRNYHPSAGGAGAMINVAGAGILSSSRGQDAARRLVDYLLSPEAQQYFADETFEYPLVEGVATHPELLPLAQINQPNVDLGSLADLERTLQLLREVGVL